MVVKVIKVEDPIEEMYRKKKQDIMVGDKLKQAGSLYGNTRLANWR